MKLEDNYKEYRWFFTSSNKLVLGGKSADQNDYLLKEIKKSKENYLVMHTSSPGSPFCVILSPMSSLSEKDKLACATFTACFSQVWKQGKKQIQIDSFPSSSLSKPKLMKTGSWVAKIKLGSYKIKPSLYLIKQKNILRAVPEQAIKAGKKPLAKITQGRQDKQKLLPKLKDKLKNFSDEEILSALPSGGLTVK